jgi:hypothetical protein
MRYECALECCPCRDQCSNRQLQDGATLVTAVVDCGCKGVGVIALEDVQAGQFVGEYVGEVLSSREAKLRCQVLVIIVPWSNNTVLTVYSVTEVLSTPTCCR